MCERVSGIDANPHSSATSAHHRQVVVNCCGPYRFHGEPVVRACIAAGTHQVDVSGEPQYIERMQLEHSEAALAAGVYIVSACGFDSIPADLGTVYTEREFAASTADGTGVVNAVETYLTSWIKGGYRGGATVHYGTWASAVHGLANWAELGPLRRQLYGGKRLPQQLPALANRGALHRVCDHLTIECEFELCSFVFCFSFRPPHQEPMHGRWSLPFPGADRSVVQRSQRQLHDTTAGGKRPVQIRTYMSFDSLFAVLGIAVFGAVFVALSKFEWGRQLLLAHPKLFSGGMFSHTGPSEETMRNTWFSIVFRASGWSAAQKLAANEGPDMELTTRVTASNPGYGATCVAVLLAARTLLEEADRVPVRGGVLAPGATFAKTTMIERLQANGFEFEVLTEKKAL